MRGTRLKTFWKDERGYTLPEVLTAVAIAGVLTTIAVIIFLALLERWRVEAAADQLASDMRLAHSDATQQLTDWRLTTKTGSTSYTLVKLKTVYDGEPSQMPPTVETRDRSLPDGTMIFSSTASAAAQNPDVHEEFYVEFNADGTIHVKNGPNGHVKVSSEDEDPTIRVTYLSAISGVRIGEIVYG